MFRCRKPKWVRDVFDAIAQLTLVSKPEACLCSPRGHRGGREEEKVGISFSCLPGLGGQLTVRPILKGEVIHSVLLIRIRDPVPFWPLDPGSKIGFFRIPDLGSQSHIFESLMIIFCIKSSIILWKLAQIFLFSNSNTNNFQFCEIWANKTRYDKKKFSPLSFVSVFGSGIRDPGSGMGKNQDPGSGINIPDPQHWIHYR